MSEPLVISDPKLCGLGEGERCCAFLVLGMRFICGRTVDGLAEQIRARLASGTMAASYDPGEVPYPDCQTQREGWPQYEAWKVDPDRPDRHDP
jgi:hypothetical protein